jgi:excisionase family DNA binding protein
MAGTHTPSFLTVAEVARICRVHEITVRRHIKQGRLRAVRVGKAIRIKSEDFERYLGTQEQQPVGGILTEDDPIFRLMGIGVDKDGATDVSENKYKYLAEAYADLHED